MPLEPGPLVEIVLREIAQHLAVLASTGETASIDIRSLPLSGADKAALEEILGRGDVQMRLDLVGDSEIWETSYAGVWWVRHLSGDRIVAERLEITSIPEILITHTDDIAAASVRLNNDLLSASADKELEHV